MIAFLRQLRGFAHPYRGRFFSGPARRGFYGFTNGALLGAAKVVIDLIFSGSSNFHESLEKEPC